LAEDVNVFLARGHQGVNFHPGVWHHPLLVLVEQQDFIVIDRGGPGDNLVEASLEKPVIVTLS
jgi:ureidoglycolate lyase